MGHPLSDLPLDDPAILALRKPARVPVPNGVPIGLAELLETRGRWIREHRAERPGWWRPLARIAWRVELEHLERMDVSEVAARMRGVLDAGSRSRGSLTACQRP